MDVAAVEAYLHQHIPISRHMGVRVVAMDEAGVRLTAPLAPNLNHQSTAFGGSVSSLAILAAWTVAHTGLHGRGIDARVVIQKSTMDYIAPIHDELEAFCPAPSDPDWERFVAAVEKRGRGRLRLEAQVTSAGAEAARFHGVYVALT